MINEYVKNNKLLINEYVKNDKLFQGVSKRFTVIENEIFRIMASYYNKIFFPGLRRECRAKVVNYLTKNKAIIQDFEVKEFKVMTWEQLYPSFKKRILAKIAYKCHNLFPKYFSLIDNAPCWYHFIFPYKHKINSHINWNESWDLITPH